MYPVLSTRFLCVTTGTRFLQYKSNSINCETFPAETLHLNTYAFPNIILGAHEIFHLRTELLIDSFQLSLLLYGFFQGSGQGQGLGLLLPGLCLSAVPFLRVLGRDGLLLRQQLQEHSINVLRNR